jgi:hypothetical protein
MPKYPPRDKQTGPRRARPRLAGDILQRATQGDALAAIRLGAQGAEVLRQRLLAQLPDGLREHVAAVIAKPDETVVFADAAAWAARLKLALAETPPDIGTPGAKVTVRVMPAGGFRR